MGEAIFAVHRFPPVQAFGSEASFVDAVSSTTSHADDFAIFDADVKATSITRCKVNRQDDNPSSSRTCIRRMHFAPIYLVSHHRHDRPLWAIDVRMVFLDPRYLQSSRESSLWEGSPPCRRRPLASFRDRGQQMRSSFN